VRACMGRAGETEPIAETQEAHCSRPLLSGVTLRIIPLGGESPWRAFAGLIRASKDC
jgi:hypothetical protein